MKLSARNQIKGRVVEVRKGATTAHVNSSHTGPLTPASAKVAMPV